MRSGSHHALEFSVLVQCAAIGMAVAPAHAQLDLSNYSLVQTVSLPPVLLEASGVTYNWDTHQLFIVPDSGIAITELSLSGEILSQMSLSGFEDTEGIAYLGNGQFAIAEERQQRVYRFTYSPGGTLTRSALAGASLGPVTGNDGIEGVCFEASTGYCFAVKEKNPTRILRTVINFAIGSATVIDLFSPSALGVLDLADLAVLSTVPSLSGTLDQDNLLLLSQQSARLLEVSRSGLVLSQLDLADLSTTPEGITIDSLGTIYICDETLRLFVFKPCYANCDGSTSAPRLNANDFACFLNRFAAEDVLANCDNSTGAPVLNANDFTCFLNSFAAGCT